MVCFYKNVMNTFILPLAEDNPGTVFPFKIGLDDIRLSNMTVF